MSSIRWTIWRPLDTCIDGKLIPSAPGAYRIRCRGRVVRRAIGRDREGVLDIGKSVRLRTRLAAFYRCVTAKKAHHGHMVGWRYLHVGLHRRYPPGKLEVCWCEADDGAEALRLEAKALEEYARRHGELPPLNYSDLGAASPPGRASTSLAESRTYLLRRNRSMPSRVQNSTKSSSRRLRAPVYWLTSSR